MLDGSAHRSKAQHQRSASAISINDLDMTGRMLGMTGQLCKLNDRPESSDQGLMLLLNCGMARQFTSLNREGLQGTTAQLE
jgi:hypothetical protein